MVLNLTSLVHTYICISKSPPFRPGSHRELELEDVHMTTTTTFADGSWERVAADIAAVRSDACSAIADDIEGSSEKLERLEESPLLPTAVRTAAPL